MNSAGTEDTVMASRQPRACPANRKRASRAAGLVPAVVRDE